MNTSIFRLTNLQQLLQVANRRRRNIISSFHFINTIALLVLPLYSTSIFLIHFSSGGFHLPSSSFLSTTSVTNSRSSASPHYTIFLCRPTAALPHRGPTSPLFWLFLPLQQSVRPPTLLHIFFQLVTALRKLQPLYNPLFHCLRA